MTKIINYLILIKEIIFLFLAGIFFIGFIFIYICEGMALWWSRYSAFLKAEFELIRFKFKKSGIKL